jgi:hypothetical protein
LENGQELISLEKIGDIMKIHKKTIFALFALGLSSCEKPQQKSGMHVKGNSEVASQDLKNGVVSSSTGALQLTQPSLAPSIWNSYIESGMLPSPELGAGNIVVDAQDNTIHAATFSSATNSQNVNFPRWPLVTKRTSTGHVIWSRHLGSDFSNTYDSTSKSIVKLTPDGGILVAMTFTKAPLNGTGSRSPRILLTKLSTDGNVLWSIAIDPPSNPASPLLTQPTHRSFLGMGVHHIDGFIYLLGEDIENSRSVGFVATIDKNGVPVNTQYLNLPVANVAARISPVEIFSRTDRSVVLFANYALADDSSFTKNLTERLLVLVTGPALQLRIHSLLVGSSVSVSPPTAVSNIRAAVVSRKPNFAFPIFNEATNSIFELLVNQNTTRNHVVLGGNALAPEAIFPHPTNNGLYLFSRISTRDPVGSLWPPAHMSADGHIYSLDIANQPTQSRYMGLQGTVSSAGGLRGGIADSGGNFVTASYHAGLNGMTLSVAGLQAVERRQFRSVAVGLGQFSVESSSSCQPLSAQVAGRPPIQVVPSAFLPVVPMSHVKPPISTRDATDVKWVLVAN